MVLTEDEMNGRVGARVVHIERVPTANGGPGVYHWELTIKPWPDVAPRG